MFVSPVVPPVLVEPVSVVPPVVVPPVVVPVVPVVPVVAWVAALLAVEAAVDAGKLLGQRLSSGHDRKAVTKKAMDQMRKMIQT